ncbi:unnamed protein product, partial [Didymodactylos carnosus]
LIEFLNRISISQDLYMGQSYDDVHAVYCYYGSGIILSGTVLHKILDELDWCTNNAYSQDLTDNIGRCILKSAKLPCSNTASNQNYSAYVDYRFDFDSDIDKLSKSEDFNKTLTVHPVNDLETMLKLQMYFNHVEIAEIKQDIIKHEQNIEQLSCYAPEGCNEIPWPVGVPPPFRPSTRFDVLRWDYFNETHIYLETDNDVVGIMKQDYHDDVQEIINYSISQMQRIYGSSLKYQHLLNGYRQFDPTRGTHYILDLQMLDENKNEIIKRAELMRPLGLVEIITMPFVTDNTKIFLILPLFHDDQQQTIKFLKHCNQTLFDKESRDKLEILLTHIVTTKIELQQTQKWFEPIRKEVELLRHTRVQLSITYHTLFLSGKYYNQFILIDYFQVKLRKNALIFITTPYVDIESDFLNRCRLNVIDSIQVFFPIGFYQYYPNIISRTNNVSQQTIELHKNHGWFNSYSYDNAAFYMNDYINAKYLLRLSNNTDLFDLFHHTDMHILRGPDQSLRHHYKNYKCDQIKQTQDEFGRCLIQREKGIASRSQLAMVIADEEEKQAKRLKSTTKVKKVKK